MNTIDSPQHVHSMVDQLAPAQLAVIEGLLAVMIDPVAHSIRNAPVNDEPLTEEDKKCIRRSEEWFAKNGGEGIAMEEVMAELGLSIKDFPLDRDGT